MKRNVGTHGECRQQCGANAPHRAAGERFVVTQNSWLLLSLQQLYVFSSGSFIYRDSCSEIVRLLVVMSLFCRTYSSNGVLLGAEVELLALHVIVYEVALSRFIIIMPCVLLLLPIGYWQLIVARICSLC